MAPTVELNKENVDKMSNLYIEAHVSLFFAVGGLRFTYVPASWFATYFNFRFSLLQNPKGTAAKAQKKSLTENKNITNIAGKPKVSEFQLNFWRFLLTFACFPFPPKYC